MQLNFFFLFAFTIKCCLLYLQVCLFFVFVVMEESMDTFAWTHKLECPPTLCNDLVKTMFV